MFTKSTSMPLSIMDKAKIKEAMWKTLTTLKQPEDAKIIKEAEEIVASGDLMKKIQFSKTKLADIKNEGSADKVLRLSEQSNAFKSLCEDEKLPHYKVWSDFLKEKNYIGEPLISIDKQIAVNVVDEYVAMYIYNFYCQMKEASSRNATFDKALFQIAVEKNSFYACQERIQQEAEKFKSTLITEESKPEERLAAETTLTQSANQFNNQFWSVGYFFMACTYRDIGKTLLESAGKERDDLKSVADAYFLKAYEHFLRGKELVSYNKASENKLVIDRICHKHGLAAFGASSWESGEQLFLDCLRKSLYSPKFIQKKRDDIKADVLEIMQLRAKIEPRKPY